MDYNKGGMMLINGDKSSLMYEMKKKRPRPKFV